MTEKKEKILKAALELFAKDGYRVTSTSKIATKAGVSEGLIFRHFTSKVGLLEAIIKEGEEKVKDLYGDVITEEDPKQVILKTLMIVDPTADDDEVGFWKLQYKIKWELEIYTDEKMEPLRLTLVDAFDKLGYSNPEGEANTLMLIIDGLATRYFIQEGYDLEGQVAFLKEKYNL